MIDPIPYEKSVYSGFGRCVKGPLTYSIIIIIIVVVIVIITIIIFFGVTDLFIYHSSLPFPQPMAPGIYPNGTDS